jgi:hypothetical protein
MIDRDVTVYQSLDLVKRAWHAKEVNNQSIDFMLKGKIQIGLVKRLIQEIRDRVCFINILILRNNKKPELYNC